MVSQTCIRCGSGLALLTDNDSRLLCRLCHPRQIFRRTILSAAALFLVGAVAAPVLHRRIQLVGLPDIGAPFDIQEFGTVELEDGENAALYYQAAIPPEQRDYIGVDDTEPAVDELDAVLDLGWSHATPEVKEWLKSNRSSLDLMRQGASVRQSLIADPEDQTYETFVSVRSNRSLSRLARLEAERLASLGKPGEAWAWLRVAFRHSRHVGMYEHAINRLVGAAFHAAVTASVVRWASGAQVDAALLKSALADVVNDYSLTQPASTNLRSEYFLQMHILRRYPPVSGSNPFMGMPPAKAYLKNEPEVGRRIIRLTYSNWLSQCDLPRHQRLPRRAVPPYLFEPKTGNGFVDSIPLSEIERFCECSPVAMHAVGRGMPLGEGITREQTRQTQLVILLSAQLYFRENGKLPENADDLLNEHLPKWSPDPFMTTAASMKYRRNSASESAVVWSVGPNGTDGGGSVDVRYNDPTHDLGMTIVPPGGSE